MDSKNSITRSHVDDSTRSWSLIHAGQVHPMDWADGEELLSLSAAVRSGTAAAQSFSFCPRGDRSGVVITILVTPGEPLELLTVDERRAPRDSHWFG